MGLIIFNGEGQRFKMSPRTLLRVREWCDAQNSKE
jgi:hypothetical protein